MRTIKDVPYSLVFGVHLLSTCFFLIGLSTWTTPCRGSGLAQPAPGQRAQGITLPSAFEEIPGTGNLPARYAFRSGAQAVLLEPTGFLMDPGGLTEGTGPVRIRFEGARPGARLVGENQAEGVANYLIGTSPRTWRIGIRRFSTVLCRQILPAIDLRFRTVARSLAFDLVLAPGADPDEVEMVIEGAGPIELERDGRLTVSSAFGRFALQKPTVFQEREDGRNLVDARFVLKGENRVGFEIGGFDRSAPLVIDPTLDFSTVFGGTNLDRINTIHVDATGIYLAGTTRSWNFPVLNPIQDLNPGGTSAVADAFVAKLTPDGRSLIYSTFLGGAAAEEGLAMAVNAAGQVWIAGSTRSANFPLVQPFQDALRTAGVEDGFLAKLRADGRALLFSTYLGGDGIDIIRSVALDPQGNAYVTGQTRSANFPLANAWQTTYVEAAGHWQKGNAFVAKFPAAGGPPVYSTQLGGGDGETGEAIIVDLTGAAIVGGLTWSADFPTVAPLQNQKGEPGLGTDAFVTKFRADGTAPVFSTFLGGSFNDTIKALAVDNQGSIYAAGETASRNFPVKNAFQPAFAGFYTDAFLAKIAANGSSLVFSTYLGGDTTDETARAVAVDSGGNVHVAGTATLLSNFEQEGSLALHRSGSFPLADPLQSEMAGYSLGSGEFARFMAQDGFISRFDTSGQRLLFSTYLGGSRDDYFRSLALSADGTSVYIAGDTDSTDFPSTGSDLSGGAGTVGFVTRLDLAPGRGGFLSTPGGAEWTRFPLVDSNRNGQPDAADEKVYATREGTRVHLSSPVLPKSSQASKIDLSNPHPVNGKYQTATIEFRSIAGSSGSSAVAADLPGPATFNEEEHLIRIVVTTRSYDKALRPLAYNLLVERESSSGLKDFFSGILRAVDTNQDGVYDKGQVEAESLGIASMGAAAQLGARILDLFPFPLTLDVPFQYFDVSGDGKPDYGSIDWSLVAPVMNALGFEGDFERQIFVPLGDSNGDGVADTIIWDFNHDGLPDADLFTGAPLSGPAHPRIEHALYFAQFGDGVVPGAYIRSQIVLYNLDSEAAASARILLHDGQGQPLSVPINGQTVSGETLRNVPAGGMIALRSDGGPSLRIGSVTVISDRPLAGVILFDGSIGVCGVGSSAANDGGFIAPIERSAATGVNTGIAVMNLRDEAATPVAELLDPDGKLLASSSFLLPARGHLARYVHEFTWDRPVDLNNFVGLLRVRADRRLAATVLHNRPGEIATLPVAQNFMPFVLNPALTIPATPESRQQRSKRLVFAHFGDGAGGGYSLSSQIVLANLEPNRTASAQIRIRTGNGSPFEVDLDGESVPGSSSFTISPGGLRTLKTDGLGELRAGSVLVDSDQLLAGVILFGGTAGLAGVGAGAELPNGFLAPIETVRSRNVNSGIAVTNLHEQPVALQLRLLNASGVELARASHQLVGNGHVALFVNELTWNHQIDFSNFLGLLEVKADGPISGTVLRTDPGRFATLPVTPILN